MAGPLTGLRVLDLSRVLAGPWCTQILADLGADVIKVERPGFGDDTRHWGPPWCSDRDGNPTDVSAYYLAANRGKRSITIDISQADGQELVRQLAAGCGNPAGLCGAAGRDRRVRFAVRSPARRLRLAARAVQRGR